MKILIVDDDSANRMILSAYLKKDGYQTVLAEDGQQAIDIFQMESPDMVLMDVIMPIMDGYEATATIKKMTERFVPVIFLTAMTDDSALSKCVEVGGDDFLTKPYSRIILSAKIDALVRVSKLYNQVVEQRLELEKHNIQQQQEQKYARNVFNSIMNKGCLDRDIFHLHISPVSLFNGDVVLAAIKPSGGVNLLFGDFTGHGLGAALGALPLSDIFYAMSAKGYTTPDICREINLKLKQQLPIGMFLAACVMDLDPANRVLKVWNGAIPGAYILRKNGTLIALKSNNLPFGILSNKEFSDKAEIHEIFDGDRIVLTTDGILEAENTEGEMLGSERFEKKLANLASSKDLLTDVIQMVDGFTGEQAYNDDITLAIIDNNVDYISHLSAETYIQKSHHDSEWSSELMLYYDTLKIIDPVPLFNQITNFFLGDRKEMSKLNMIFTELFCNSLDHGLLNLDSDMKSTAEGFMQFYENKNENLANLGQGKIKIQIYNKIVDDKSQLTISMEDSGKGFDTSKFEQINIAQNQGYFGRGIPLIKTFCQSVEFNEKGNRVECIFNFN